MFTLYGGHAREWLDGACCHLAARGRPNSDPSLSKNSVRLLIIVATDSSNETRAVAIHNLAALWRLRVTRCTAARRWTQKGRRPRSRVEWW
jgi:hypothetical protein